MSIRVMSYVWTHSPEREEGLLVHLALADFADDDGVCWPKMATIAAKARVTPRGARGIVARLERDGHLRRVVGRGKGRHNAYQLVTSENRNGLPISLADKIGTTAHQNRKVQAPKSERGRTGKGGTVLTRQGSAESFGKVARTSGGQVDWIAEGKRLRKLAGAAV